VQHSFGSKQPQAGKLDAFNRGAHSVPSSECGRQMNLCKSHGHNELLENGCIIWMLVLLAIGKNF